MDNLFIFILSLALTFPILSPLPADLTVADHSATTVGTQEHIGEEKENVSVDQTVKSKKPDESISPDPLIASKPSLTVSLSSIEDPVQCKEMVETISGVVYDTVSDALSVTGKRFDFDFIQAVFKRTTSHFYFANLLSNSCGYSRASEVDGKEHNRHQQRCFSWT